MASLGHIVVGIAAARSYQADPAAARASFGAIAFWSALSFLPDADVIGFAFGVRYEDEWGHRGATHSLVFSCALGVALGVLARVVHRPALRTGVTASLVLVSHALLDTLTDGGLGCALFWPFDLTRYFAPWTPIPVAPIGLAFFSPYGLFVAATELVLFGPLLWFVLRPRVPLRHSITALLVGAWVTAFWLLLSTDPVRERVVRVLLQDDTEYAPGFSETALDAVEPGDGYEQVRGRLGAPFRELPGGPETTCWVYSRSPDEGYFRARGVCFTNGRVIAVVRRWFRE